MGLSGAERQRRHREAAAAWRAALPKLPCGCGCGTMIPPITTLGRQQRYAHGHNPQTVRWVKGDPALVGNRYGEGRGGPLHGRWQGGEWRAAGGYWRLTITAEQAATWPTALRHGGGWSIMRSHAVWNGAHPDDLVEPGEHIHHRNRQRDDDDPTNLAKIGRHAHLRAHNLEHPRPRDPRTGRFTA